MLEHTFIVDCLLPKTFSRIYYYSYSNVKSFLNAIEHTLHWIRDEFKDLLEQAAETSYFYNTVLKP